MADPEPEVGDWDGRASLPEPGPLGKLKRPAMLDLTGAAYGGNTEVFRGELIKLFKSTWELFDLSLSLFKDDDALMIQAEPLRHPPAFYLAHTAAFAISKLVLAGLLKERLDPKIESVFLVGVDEISWDSKLTPETRGDWPSVSELRAYRNRAKTTILRLLERVPLTLPLRWDSPLWVLPMIINHEDIHLETSAVITRQVPLSALVSNPEFAHCPYTEGAAPTNKFVTVPGGVVRLGRTPEDTPKRYGWDIEFGAYTETVCDFEVSQYQVSNGEYLEFVESGGYRTLSYWDGAGRSWVKSGGGRSHPLFWVRSGSPSGEGVGRTYKLRTLTAEIALPLSWPVLVNYYEAAAFTRWKAAQSGDPIRLPSENEWHRIYDRAFEGRLEYPEWDCERPPGNIDLRYWGSECPVDLFPALSGGLCGVVGNAWSWCCTPSDALRGYRAHPLYKDFSLPCCTSDLKSPNVHFMLKGGSWLSCGNNGALARSRYAFRPHFHQFASFVYVRTTREPIIPKVPAYESDQAVAQYLDFHYDGFHRSTLLPRGIAAAVPNFNVAVAELAKQWSYRLDSHTRSALDLGCAVGRAVFELAERYSQVVGVEFSAYFCQVSEQMRTSREVKFPFFLEGDLTQVNTYRLPTHITREMCSRVSFLQGDACNLAPQFRDYDLVLAANLIDRLPDPRKFLNDIKSRIVIGGLLVVTSPYTWLEAYTPKSLWVGGYYDGSGKAITTLSGLVKCLAPEFRLVAVQDVPILIRDTVRKHQLTIVNASVWHRLDLVDQAQ